MRFTEAREVCRNQLRRGLDYKQDVELYQYSYRECTRSVPAGYASIIDGKNLPEYVFPPSSTKPHLRIGSDDKHSLLARAYIRTSFLEGNGARRKVR